MPKNIRAIKKRNVPTISVAEVVNTFIQSPRVQKRQPGTIAEYENNLRFFHEWCSTHAMKQNLHTKKWIAQPLVKYPDLEPITLDQINDHVVACFVDHLKETHKPHKKASTELSSHTLHGYVKCIKSFLKWCMVDEQYSDYIKPIILQRIEKPQIEETIIEIFSKEDIDALFAACDKEESEHLQLRDRAMISVLLDTGIRSEGLRTLTIENLSLDPKDAYVRILEKGRKWGEVGLGDQSRRILQKYIRRFREPTIEYAISHKYPHLNAVQLKQLIQKEMRKSVVFCSRTGAALTDSGICKIFVRLGARAGMEEGKCHCHVFRHTFAVLFMRNGGDIYKLSRLLRHSSVKVTENYLKSLKQSEARIGAKSVVDNL